METITLTNLEIFNINEMLSQYDEDEQLSIPVVVNFYIQKNISILKSKNIDIQKARNFIIKKYGKLYEDSEEGQIYQVPPESIEIAQKELDELMFLKQEIKYYPIKLSALADCNIDTKQLNAILFMIEDDLSETKEDK